jgi:hypothetical protein
MAFGNKKQSTVLKFLTRVAQSFRPKAEDIASPVTETSRSDASTRTLPLPASPSYIRPGAAQSLLTRPGENSHVEDAERTFTNTHHKRLLDALRADDSAIARRIVESFPEAEQPKALISVFRLHADPSQDSSFTPWLAQQYADLALNLSELGPIYRALRLFSRAFPEARSIERYSTLAEMFSAVSQFDEAELSLSQKLERKVIVRRSTPSQPGPIRRHSASSSREIASRNTTDDWNGFVFGLMTGVPIPFTIGSVVGSMLHMQNSAAATLTSEASRNSHETYRSDDGNDPSRVSRHEETFEVDRRGYDSHANPSHNNESSSRSSSYDSDSSSSSSSYDSSPSSSPSSYD